MIRENFLARLRNQTAQFSVAEIAILKRLDDDRLPLTPNHVYRGSNSTVRQHHFHCVSPVAPGACYINRKTFPSLGSRRLRLVRYARADSDVFRTRSNRVRL